jgi:NaMN:DMB phosphoribosyltransferase
LGLRSEDGTGAAAALPLLRLACKLGGHQGYLSRAKSGSRVPAGPDTQGR